MTFNLKDKFVEKYKKIEPPFGFNGLGKLTYYRTYSRLKENGENEEWFETIRRVVEGTYSIQKRHIEAHALGWDEEKAHESAEEMYDRMFYMKFLPPGRGLWSMGAPIIEERGQFAALNNCAFVSTDNLDKDGTKPFEFMMDMSMLGVGVGFDVKGAGKIPILKPNKTITTFDIPDTREGWVESLKHALNAFIRADSYPQFDYTKIRAKGALIKGFGGKSSGAQPLRKLHEQIYHLLTKRIGQTMSETDITDIMNMIGVCVVAGNVRRSAQIVFGDPNSEEYLKLKDYVWDADTMTYKGSNVHRAEYGWTSNNSVFAELGMDYTELAKQTAKNGEPGYAWLENMQSYSKMGGEPDFKDLRVRGGNPCFTYDTEILTADGYIPIGLLEKLGNESLELINKDGEIVSGKVWYSGDKETINLIYNKNGQGHTIKCTPNHIFMLNNGSEEEAQNLKGKKIMPFYNMKDLSKADKQIVSLGFVQGDGRTNPAPRQKIVTAIFGKKDGDVYDYFDNTLTYDLLETYGFDKNKLPERNLPTQFYNWNTKEKCDFITGLYSANGSVLKNAKRVSFKSTNYTLVSELKNYFETLNIDSYITVNKEKINKFYNGEYLCKESYDLNIANFDSIVEFADKINFIQKYKRELLEIVILVKSPTIQHIVKGDIEKVYDFSLNDNKHWGVIEGFIAHNCLEQSLESYEMCCLVETFPTMHSNQTDYLRTIKFAYLYGKTVTLGNTHFVDTNRVQLRNRRIGMSMSGLAQFIDTLGIHALKELMEDAYAKIQYYDDVYSEWLAIPNSIKTTSIKPSGTVSLLPGVTPGMHYPESNYYIRRMRIAIDSDLLPIIKKANYKVEPDITDPTNTLVVEIPVAIDNVRTINEVSMWEQLELAAFIQQYWADNQVSCTITFKDHEKDQIANALNYFQYRLKGISFLPKLEKGAYAQMPYEEITQEKYNELIKDIKELNIKKVSVIATPDKYCDNDTCEI